MLAYNVLKITTMVMIFSVGYLIGEFFLKRFGKVNDKTFIKYVRRILLLISTILLIWLLFNKELFHWNYDIATGEPVDHYSTYGRCMVFTMIAMLSNITAEIVRFKRKH